MLTCLCYIDPLEPNFNKVKLAMYSCTYQVPSEIHVIRYFAYLSCQAAGQKYGGETTHGASMSMSSKFYQCERI